jgi:hypothetical protein
MNGLHNFAAAIALIVTGTSAVAQSTNTMSDTRMRESSARVGIVIPLGSGGSKAERAPRLEAWSDHRSQRDEFQLRLRDDRDVAQPLRLGVTIGEQPRMIANGREVPGQQDRKNVSALGWVGIGVGVVVILGAVFFYEANRVMNN